MAQPYTVQSKKSGKTYFLHKRKLLNVTIYFFGGTAQEGTIESLPTGYEIGENQHTGLPFLRKIR